VGSDLRFLVVIMATVKELQKKIKELSEANAQFKEQETLIKGELERSLFASPVSKPSRRDLSLQALLKSWSGDSTSLPIEEFLRRMYSCPFWLGHTFLSSHWFTVAYSG
jgi:hypothetical protein